jgi:hypothetical protein
MDDPLELGGALLALVSEFVEQTKIDGIETLFVIHPIARNPCLRSRPLSSAWTHAWRAAIFEAFKPMRRTLTTTFALGASTLAPFPSFQVLSRDLLKKGSDSLLGSAYYAEFTPEMLRAVGMPR